VIDEVEEEEEEEEEEEISFRQINKHNQTQSIINQLTKHN